MENQPNPIYKPLVVLLTIMCPSLPLYMYSSQIGTATGSCRAFCSVKWGPLQKEWSRTSPTSLTGRSHHKELQNMQVNCPWDTQDRHLLEHATTRGILPSLIPRLYRAWAPVLCWYNNSSKVRSIGECVVRIHYLAHLHRYTVSACCAAWFVGTTMSTMTSKLMVNQLYVCYCKTKLRTYSVAFF